MSRAKGNIAEDIAVVFLKENNFKIVHRNFYAKKIGELDIIAYKDKVLHFIEVKSGTGEPIYNITASKLSKLIRSIEYYIQKYNITTPYQLDAIVIKNTQNTQIDFIQNITL